MRESDPVLDEKNLNPEKDDYVTKIQSAFHGKIIK
jgi:hypothetical protein